MNKLPALYSPTAGAHVVLEPLEQDERDFLIRRWKHDRRIYIIVYAGLMALVLIMSYAVGWYRKEDVGPDLFSYKRFVGGTLLLGSISTIAVYISYRANLGALIRDIRHNLKCVERTVVVKKKFVPTGNAYFFYLSSPHKLSIEVSEEDFRGFEVQDEINIEYTPRAKVYLQYY